MYYYYRSPAPHTPHCIGGRPPEPESGIPVLVARGEGMQYAVACKACREIFKSMIRRKNTMRALTIVAALMLGLTSASAQDYPTRPITMVVPFPAGGPTDTVAELSTYAKAEREKVTFAHAGLGAASHLCGMLFQSGIGTKLTAVPYRGGGPLLNDLLGGQVDLGCEQATTSTGPISAKRVK